jgi:hypothetical protein
MEPIQVDHRLMVAVAQTNALDYYVTPPIKMKKKVLFDQFLVALCPDLLQADEIIVR